MICGKPQFADDEKDVLLHPVLIAEVLSQSTEASDRGFKFQQYQLIESLKEYVLVSQREARVEIFERADKGRRLLTVFQGKDAIARFASVNCEIALADIYTE